MRFFSILILLTIANLSMAQDSNFHVYLCFGQSNMYGSAEIEEVDKHVPERLMVMASTDYSNGERKLGQWYSAVPPLSHQNAGLSPADYFGRTMVELLPDSVTVGLINVAIGGCDIRVFDKDLYVDYMDTYKEEWFSDILADYGGAPYYRLLHLAKLAQKQGVIKGIILHQGEQNTGDAQWPQYVKTVYENILKDLGLNANEVPLIAGEVVHEDINGMCSAMNPIIRSLPKTIPTAAVVSSKDCTEIGDVLHFDSNGVRKLGKRYALKMMEMKQ